MGVVVVTERREALCRDGQIPEIQEQAAGRGDL